MRTRKRFYRTGFLAINKSHALHYMTTTIPSASRFKLAPDDIRKVRPLLISQAMDWLINDLSIDPRWASDLRRLQVELGSLRST